jgi:hypothetical protein
VTLFWLHKWGLIPISERDFSLYDHVHTDWPAYYIDRYQDWTPHFNLISLSTYLTIPISYLLQHEMKGRDRHQINKIFLMLLQLSGRRRHTRMYSK